MEGLVTMKMYDLGCFDDDDDLEKEEKFIPLQVIR